MVLMVTVMGTEGLVGMGMIVKIAMRVVMLGMVMMVGLMDTVGK